MCLCCCVGRVGGGCLIRIVSIFRAQRKMRIGAGLGAHPCCGFAGGELYTLLCFSMFSMLCWRGVIHYALL